MTMFHLWIVPTGEVYDRLAGVIADLSARHHGPAFDPHLTLLGRLEGEEEVLVDRTRQFARALHPFDVRLKEPGYEAQYFRCLFLPAEPSPPLLQVHQRATQIFNAQPTSPFDPHVSLLYGLFPESLKQEIIKALPPGLPGIFPVSRLQLIRAGSTNPQDWHVAETLDL
ncbi:MAG: 2'-5' RNA ligase family protein [Nitrospira sp. SB0666_bin_27]|nr:2'-5' RNA ligase family protein [Nitrospira sp. SB0666_bin_27]MYF25036.1 2'-5' RNA ligase family protein [Nitrospira sp. SB0678_bin_10]